jgi:serine protease inhibitor ecotin
MMIHSLDGMAPRYFVVDKVSTPASYISNDTNSSSQCSMFAGGIALLES